MQEGLTKMGLPLKAQDKEYRELLEQIKGKVRSAQIKAAVSVNKELINLYWEIGKLICEKQAKAGWGDSVVEMLANDLRHEFPGMRGFSRSNLFAIRKWHLFYASAGEKVQQLVGQLPWGHNIRITTKAKSIMEASFYLSEAIAHNWSRNSLIHQMESGLYGRAGKITSNFELTLPRPQSELAKQTLKDPYLFDFLELGKDAEEKEIETSLINHITRFLLELGAGFSFLGSQYHLEIAGKDYYIDLLFYHLVLRCYVVIELKTGDFKPEYAGKLNFYLSAVDNTLRHREDNPTIGLLLCKTNNKVIAEYALKDISKPIGISEYKLAKAMPPMLKKSLPTVKEIENTLSGFVREEGKPKNESKKALPRHLGSSPDERQLGAQENSAKFSLVHKALLYTPPQTPR